MAIPLHLKCVALGTACFLGCTHGATTKTPTAAVASGASVSTPKTGDVEADAGSRDVHIAGEFTPEDLNAIFVLVKREDTLPLLSLERHGDEVRAMTGSVCGELCGGGNMLILRKMRGRWAVVDRGVWVS